MVWIKNHAHIIRGLLLLAIAIFFGYRYIQLPHGIYLAYITVFGGLGLITLINQLPARWQNFGLNLGISLFFLDFVFAEINLAKVAQAIVEADYRMLLLSMAMVVIHIYFRTVRWQWLLKPMGEVAFWPACRALLIGITGNTVLPARAGEFLRAYVLGRSTGLSKTGVFATLVVERIFDGLTVLLVLLAVIVLGVQNEQLQLIGILGAIFYVGIMVGLIVFMAKRHWADALITKFLPQGLAHQVLGLLDGFSSGLAILKSPYQLAMVTFWNMLTWIMIPISFWFALLAFDFGSPIPWQAPLLMLPAMALGLTVPAAPGGVGLVQAAIKLTLDLTFAGLPVAANFQETVAAAGILIHFCQFAPEVIPGIFCFMYEGLSTREVGVGRGLTQPEANIMANLPD
ncbi:MAG TPA: lysylphosphatidylglycerol synthase transmembrane domain-containing protein [Anaerolineae bacterium]|nr:lysylphosphatidylglycerol synthase transmembrane domain-containing protein [Anaerolineae bacterium]